MRGAKIIRIINLRALSFCEAPEKLRKFANFANLGISYALLSVSIQCWFTSKSETSFMAPNFSLRSYFCIASPPSSSPSSSSVVVSEISRVPTCPHMPLSWRGLHPQWCKHLGPPHRPLNWGRAGCNAGCNGAMAASLAATACCTSGLRRMMSSRAGQSSSVRFRLVQPRSNSDACRAMGLHLGRPRN